MPSASLSERERNATSRPSSSIVPSKLPCGCTPLRISISVDLPAPFSPQIACTSPRRMSMQTPESATTSRNRFVTSVIRRSGSAIEITSALLGFRNDIESVNLSAGSTVLFVRRHLNMR